MAILYFDTNVISYLQNSEDYKNQSWYPHLDAIWNYLASPTVVSPLVYSPAHLNDIRQGYVKDKERALAKLKFIGDITNKHCIVKYFSESSIKFETRDPIEFFLHNQEFDEHLYIPGKNKIDLLGLVKSSGVFNKYKKRPFADFIKMEPHLLNLGVELRRTRADATWYSLLLDFTEYLQGILNDGQVYKLLRTQARDQTAVADKIAGSDNPLALLDELLPQSKMGKTLMEVMKESFNMDPNNREDMMASNFMNLDLLGYKSDKISEQHGYTNLTTDASHCFYASYCDVFVTNDSKTAAKARAVVTYMNLELKVFDVAGFAEWIDASGAVNKEC